MTTQGQLPFEGAPEVEEAPELVPYAPDFTPALLGKVVGEDRVLPWLLKLAVEAPTRTALIRGIVEGGLSHIQGEQNQEDMADHVVQGLRNYGLITTDEEIPRLTEAGESVLGASEEERDRVFAAHILAHCGGLRFVDEIRRFELRGEIPTMEDLAFLDRHATAKSLSTMRAWLARAGICPGKRYQVSTAALAEVLGERTRLLFGLDEAELEFVLAARILQSQVGADGPTAAQVAEVAEMRNSEVRFRRKSLGKLLEALEAKGLVEKTGIRRGTGGSKLTFRLRLDGVKLGERALRKVLAQADLLLEDLLPLGETLELLDAWDIHQKGRAGEMLGVHLCLALGLHNLEWRTRAPNTEIDLLADRTVGLGYQRWAIQVKNVGATVSSDRIDREIGVAAGTGVTHLLFLAPRSELSRPARAEILHRSRLTHLHIFYLDRECFESTDVTATVLRALRSQAEDLAALKRRESLAREAR